MKWTPMVNEQLETIQVLEPHEKVPILETILRRMAAEMDRLIGDINDLSCSLRGKGAGR